MLGIVQGFTRFEAGVCTIAFCVIAASQLYRCLPGTKK